MPRILACFVLVVVLYLGYQWWNVRPADTEVPHAPVTSATPGAAGPARPPAPPPFQSPQSPNIAPPPRITPPIQLVNPGVLSEFTPYAAQLNEIRRTIVQGNVTDAQTNLVIVPRDALNDPAARKFIADLWNNLGVAQVAAQGMAAGVAAFRKAVALDPEGARAHVNLAHALWELKDPSLNRELLEKTVALAPEEPFPHLALADILQAKNDMKGALVHLDQAAQSAGQYPQLQAFLQVVSARIKRSAGPRQGP